MQRSTTSDQEEKWIDGKYDVKHVDFLRRANYFSDWIHVSGKQTQGRVRCCTCGQKVTASNSGHNAYRFGFDLELCSWRMIYCLTHKRRSTVSVLSGTSSDAACKLDGNDPNVSAQPRRGDWPKRVKRVMVG